MNRSGSVDKSVGSVTYTLLLDTDGGIRSDITVRPGDTTGLTFRSDKLSVFSKASGRALRSALHEGQGRSGG